MFAYAGYWIISRNKTCVNNSGDHPISGYIKSSGETTLFMCEHFFFFTEKLKKNWVGLRENCAGKI